MLFSSSINLFSSLRIIGLHMKNSINSFRHKYQFSDTETTSFFSQFFIRIAIKMQYHISSKTVNLSGVGSIFLPVNTVNNTTIRYMAGIFQFPSLGNQFETEGRGHSSSLQPVTVGVLLNSTFSPLLKFDTDLSYISQRTLDAISHQIHWVITSFFM